MSSRQGESFPFTSIFGHLNDASREKPAYERRPMRLRLIFRHANGGNFLFGRGSNISDGGEDQRELVASIVRRFPILWIPNLALYSVTAPTRS